MNTTIEKYTQIYGSPFLTWVFMWVNAIKDVALYVDWPDCVFYKSDLIYKTHDLGSELKSPSMDTKLYFSWVMPNKMVRWYDDKIKRKLSFIEENPNFNLGVVTCMPVTWLLATQYDSIYRDFQTNFIFVPSFTDKFWLDGYSVFLKELSKGIEFNANKKKLKNHISIIWFLFDRNEWDTCGNIEEIRRLLNLIWVTLDCIWLSWWNLEDLKKVDESELIVSLPYWNLASKILSKKLGIDMLEVEVPFWIKNTVDFVLEIWEKLWLDSLKINSLLSEELRIVKEKVDILDERIFLNKNYIYAGDPFLENSIKDIWKYLWMNHIKTYPYIWVRRGNKRDLRDQVDLIIRNSDFSIDIENCVEFEFGFPSYNTHFLVDRPYMWFKGVLFFIERLYNEMNQYKNKSEKENISFFN